MKNKNLTIYFILSYIISLSLIIFFYRDLNSYYLAVSKYGDNENYLQLANNFLNWEFSIFVYHPFGISILIFVINFITTIDPVILMVLLNIIFAYFSILIIAKIFSPIVSVFFIILGYEFTLISLMGGSEISAIFFILLSLFLYRYNLKKSSFITASFVYFIKPWAIALPISIGIILFFKKKKKLFLNSL